MDRRPRQHTHAGRTAERPHRGRSDLRRGRCRGVPAQHPHPVLLHLTDGRHRLHGKSGVPHGQDNAQNRSARQVVHSAYYGIRMQCASRYGHKNAREPQRPPAHHAHHTVHVVLSQTAALSAAHSRHIPKQSGTYAVCRISGRNAYGCGYGKNFQQNTVQKEGSAIRHGAAALQNTDSQKHIDTHVGEGQAVSQEDGNRDSDRIHHHLGFGLLPTRHRVQPGL